MLMYLIICDHCRVIAKPVECDIYFSGFTGGFHAGSNVYRVAPNIIGEFFSSNNSCNHGPGVATNSYVKKQFSFHRTLFFFIQYKISDLYCSTHSVFCIVLVRNWQASCTHIAVANGLYFFYSMPGDNVIKCTVTKVDFVYKFLWAELFTYYGKVFEICE